MRRLTLLWLLLTTSACGSSSDSPVDRRSAAQEDPVAVTEISLDGRAGQPLAGVSGYTSPQRLVIRSEADWEAAWATTFAHFSPRPPLVAVDFDAEMVVLVSTGAKSSGGYEIAVSGVTRDADGLRVGVLETQPGPRCGVTAAISSVVIAVKIPRSDLAATFVDDVAVADCGP